jgi:TonB family protein
MKILRMFLLAAAAVSVVGPVAGQAVDSQWNARLVGQPLYLRGFWSGTHLRFDGGGKLIGESKFWPVTLSGVEVTSAAVEGGSLVIYGHRVALVASGDGRQGLERRLIDSGSRKKPHDRGDLQINIEPDSTGSFDRALAIIFANGLAELSTSVPPYWKCYAASYFVPASISENAENDVTQCTTNADARAMPGVEPAYNAGPGVLPPKMTVEAPIVYTVVGRQLGISGTAVVHMRIGADGIPLGLQVIRALGVGLDEQALDAASHYRFNPARRAGVSVATNANIEVHFAEGMP